MKSLNSSSNLSQSKYNDTAIVKTADILSLCLCFIVKHTTKLDQEKIFCHRFCEINSQWLIFFILEKIRQIEVQKAHNKEKYLLPNICKKICKKKWQTSLPSSRKC